MSYLKNCSEYRGNLKEASELTCPVTISAVLFICSNPIFKTAQCIICNKFSCTEQKYYTGLFKMIVGVLTTCHTQYTWDSSICIFLFNTTTLQVFVTYLTGALYVHPMWFYKHQHDNHHRNCHHWHATDSLERTPLSCWCL